MTEVEKMASVVGYWHALTISRMEPLAQLGMFVALETRITPELFVNIQAHFLDITGDKK